MVPRYIIISANVALLISQSLGDRMIMPFDNNEDKMNEDHQVMFPRRCWGWVTPFFLLDNYWNNTRISGPKYEIEVDDDKIELTYDVEEYDNESLNVEIKTGVLSISGERRTEDSGKLSVSSFHHTFSVDPKIQHKDVSAQITLDKKLVVVVSKKGDGEPRVSKVPILSFREELVE
jgi:HSP20 family molecular chaperone IbpA